GKKHELKLYHKWAVRTPRPVKQRLDPTVPLITGQRVLDSLFPMSKGGTGAIPGAFGTGKCVAAGTPILLGDGQLIAIDELYNRFAPERKPGDGFDEQFIEARGVSVFSFDGARLVKQEISHVYRGKTEKLLKIRTASGRSATVTPAHKLVRFRPDARFEERPSVELKVGDFIALPRKVPLNASYQTIDPYSLEARLVEPEAIEAVRMTTSRLSEEYGSIKALAQKLGFAEAVVRGYSKGPNRPSTTFVAKLYSLAGLEKPEVSRLTVERGGSSVKIPRVVDEDLGEFLGLLVSDGMIAGREIRFFNNDIHLLRRFRELGETLFEARSALKRFRTVDGVAIHSTVIIQLLRALGFPKERKSRNAVVPSVIMKSPDSVAGAFLRGYFLGDGSFSEGTLEVSSESKKLIDGMSYLLTRLGVLYSIMGGKREGRRLICKQHQGAEELPGSHEA
ncbi:MAG: hypothetical protein E6K90_10675, partial [Thaumarchaeota archaeon]